MVQVTIVPTVLLVTWRKINIIIIIALFLLIKSPCAAYWGLLCSFILPDSYSPVKLNCVRNLEFSNRDREPQPNFLCESKENQWNSTVKAVGFVPNAMRSDFEPLSYISNCKNVLKCYNVRHVIKYNLIKCSVVDLYIKSCTKHGVKFIASSTNTRPR